MSPSGLSNFNQLQSGTIFLSHEEDGALGFTTGTLKLLSDRFNIHNPLTCIQKQSFCADIFLFGLNINNPYQAYSKNPAFFQQFLFYYKEKAKKVIDTAKVLMPKAVLKGDNAIDQPSKPDLIGSLDISTYWLTTPQGDVSLTKKEYTIFTEIGRGLETKEIAILLGKPIGTVNNVIDKIKKKTGLSYKNELRDLYIKNHIILR